MALRKRLLHTRRAGAGPDTDWWYLVFDTETTQLCVIHEWGRAEDHQGGIVTGGTVALELAAFLARKDDPGQRELVRLLATIFDDRSAGAAA